MSSDKSQENKPELEPETDPATKQNQPGLEFEEIRIDTRRSKRIPKMSARALESLECDEWHNKDDT